MVLAVSSVGYFIGVWTACTVLRQPQRAYEDGVRAAPVSALVALQGNTSRLTRRRL